jgi:D-glycero-alpha-D-manno-heptose 1-phosphate guanylyltransferase
LDYQIAYLKRFGFKKFVISTGYKAEIIKTHYRDHAGILFVHEDEPLGTGGGILKALPLIKADNFIVLNGDTLFLMDYFQFFYFSGSRQNKSTIALKRVSDPSRYGTVILNEEKQILDFSEKPDDRKISLINAGIYLLNKRQLQDIKVPRVCSVETDIFPLLIDLGLYGFETMADFIDIGTPEALGQIEDFVKMHQINLA